MYHVPYTHGSPLRVNPRFGQATPPDDRLGFQVRPGLGNGLGVRMEDADRFAETVEPPIGDYLRATQATAMAHLGPVRGDLQLIHGALFPNVGLVPSQFTIRIAHPRGPQTFEVWSYCLFDKGAPPDVRDEVRKRYLRNFGPGGLFEQDDGENWTQCSASTTGFMSRQLGFQHQLGLGHDRHHEDLPGLVANLRSEMNQRGFYSRWSQHMQAEPGVATVVD
jgi:3-phenylpropionate/trans-cinnamate dioxygenase alpha subunit